MNYEECILHDAVKINVHDGPSYLQWEFDETPLASYSVRMPESVIDLILAWRDAACDPSKRRGLVCCYCGEGFGYAGETPDEDTLKAAYQHEANCIHNPYIAEIKRLRDAGKELLEYSTGQNELKATAALRLLEKMNSIFQTGVP